MLLYSPIFFIFFFFKKIGFKFHSSHGHFVLFLTLKFNIKGFILWDPPALVYAGYKVSPPDPLFLCEDS